MAIADVKVASGPAADLRETPISRGALVAIVVSLGLAYSFNGMDRSVFPALLSPITKEFGLDAAEGGFLANVFTLNIAIFGAAAGWFMGRLGRKWTLVGGLIAYSAFTFLIPLARDYVELAFLRAMTGAGEALHIAACFSMIGAYFGRQRGAFIGINNSFFGVGTFLGPFLGTQLFAMFGSWRAPFYLYGVAGLVSALAVLLLVPRQFSEKVDDEVPPTPEAAERCPDTLMNCNAVLCVAAFFFTGYSFLAYAALYTLFLRDSLGYSVVAAGTAYSMFGIGALTGVLGGWLGEKLKRYGLIGALLIMAGSGYLMFNGATSLGVQMVLSLVFGAMLSGFLYPRFLAVAQRSVQPRHIGGVMSMMIPLFYIAGFIAGPVFGKLVPVVGWSNAGALSISLTAAIAAVLAFFISPSRMRGV